MAGAGISPLNAEEEGEEGARRVPRWRLSPLSVCVCALSALSLVVSPVPAGGGSEQSLIVSPELPAHSSSAPDPTLVQLDGWMDRATDTHKSEQGAENRDQGLQVSGGQIQGKRAQPAIQRGAELDDPEVGTHTHTHTHSSPPSFVFSGCFMMSRGL